MPTWDRPAALALLALLPCLALWANYQRRRQAQLRTQLVTLAAAPTQLPALAWPTWLAPSAHFSGVILLILALAGPRWGASSESTASRGRDVLVVLDLSRSMTATDVEPTRWQAARAALIGLADTLTQHGGHRVALVVFAARARIVCPLTTDLDFFRTVLADLDPTNVPGDLGADASAVSGTRIGAGVQLAVSLLDGDENVRGYAEVLLLTDGDDPATDDEWRLGTRAAQAAGVPVHVIGVGEIAPAVGKWPVPGQTRQGQPVLTRQHRDVAQALATGTGGQYLSAERSVLDVGQFFRTRLEPLGDRDRTGEPVPTHQPRHTEVLLLAVVSWLVAWWAHERIVFEVPPTRTQPNVGTGLAAR